MRIISDLTRRHYTGPGFRTIIEVSQGGIVKILGGTLGSEILSLGPIGQKARKSDGRQHPDYRDNDHQFNEREPFLIVFFEFLSYGYFSLFLTDTTKKEGKAPPFYFDIESIAISFNK